MLKMVMDFLLLVIKPMSSCRSNFKKVTEYAANGLVLALLVSDFADG